MPAAKGRRMIGTWRHLGRRVWYPPGTFRSADSGTVAERTPARRPSRPPRPRPEPERGRCLVRESLRPSDSSSCLVTGVLLHTVETAAILEPLGTRGRRGTRPMRKTIRYVFAPGLFSLHPFAPPARPTRDP